MSYILEALKKSQQERELGRVPGLHTVPLFAEEPVRHSTHHWALLAVGLAALAVVIALYAAFRSPEPRPGEGRGEQAASSETPAGLETQAPSQTSPAPAAPSVPAAPLVSPPPPKMRPGTPEPAPSRSATLPTPLAAPEPLAPAAETPAKADWETLALRQLAAEQAALNAAREVLQDEPHPAPVPEDLVQEIRAFKEQLRREQQGETPPRARRPSPKIPEDPTQLKPTPQQQAEMPAYLMTVHVYDPDPARRFVVINALRYREGEETREGFKVESILKEGVVLSYLGRPFYVSR